MPIAVVSVLFLLFHKPFEQALDGTRGSTWLDASGPWAGLVGAGLLVADSVLPIPGSALTVALGRMYGTAIGAGYALVGWLGAGYVVFGLTRLVGRGVACRLVGASTLARLHSFFEQRGIVAIAITRMIPMIPEVLFCLAGLSRMPWGRFTVGLVAGSLPPAFILSALGDLGRTQPVKVLLFAFMAPILLSGVFRWRSQGRTST